MHSTVNVGAMHCVVTTNRPTSPLARQACVIDLANEQQILRVRLHLRMAFQTKIVIRLDQKLAVDRSVRGMANSATFTHRFVLENECPCLFAMALRAGL